MLNFPVGCPLKDILLRIKLAQPEVDPASIVLATILPKEAPSPLLMIDKRLPPLKEKKPTMRRNPPVRQGRIQDFINLALLGRESLP